MVADRELVPLAPRGWRAGLGNLFSKEQLSWWGTRRWLIHLVLWTASINGFVLLVMLSDRRNNPAGQLNEVLQVFVQLGGFFGTIGAVLVTQGAIVGEKHSGTAAWLLTKPLSRSAFVLAKFLATAQSMLLFVLVIPSVVFLAEVRIVLGVTPVLTHFLEALGLLVQHYLFYIAFTLMLGAVFNSRGAVSGTALGFWLAGEIAANLVPKWLYALLPWPLIRVAASVAVWQSYPLVIWRTALAALLWTLVVIAVGLWRFEREEF